MTNYNGKAYKFKGSYCPLRQNTNYKALEATKKTEFQRKKESNIHQLQRTHLHTWQFCRFSARMNQATSANFGYAHQVAVTAANNANRNFYPAHVPAMMTLVHIKMRLMH